MSDAGRTRREWWGLAGVSLLVSMVASASILLVVWSAEPGTGPTLFQETWVPWVLVVLPAALAGGAAALVARLRAWGLLVPPAAAATHGGLAAGVAPFDHRVGLVATAICVLIGAAGAVLGVWVADRVQAPTSPAVDPPRHTRRVLASLGFYVTVASPLSFLVSFLANPGGPDWDLAGLLTALVITVAVAALVAVRKPPLPVWGWLLLIGVGAAAAWVSLPDLGPVAALTVALAALGVLGFTHHLLAGLMIGATGLLYPPLVLAGGLYIAAYAVQESSSTSPTPPRTTADT